MTRPLAAFVSRRAWPATWPAWSGPAIIALACTVLYGAKANPAVGGGNSGEFQVMASLLGIAHPPSYPLYLLLAKGASLLPLPGDVAWRINMLTALLAGAAVFWAGCLPLALGIPKRPEAQQVAGMLAAALTGAMPRLWSLAVEAEVFSLHLALVLAFWCCLAAWQRPWRPPAHATRANGTDRVGHTGQVSLADQVNRVGQISWNGRGDGWLLLAALLAALGLANHRTFLFIAGAGALFVLLTRPATLRRGRLLLGGVALVGVGLSPYLYVVRGLLWPVAYFSPTDVHRLSRGEVWYVLEGNASGETGGGEVVWALFANHSLLMRRSEWLWGHLAGQFGPWGGVLAVAGAVGLLFLLWRNWRWTGTALLGATGAAVFAMSYAKYPDGDRYLLPLETLLALGLASGLSAGASALVTLADLSRRTPYPMHHQSAGASALVTLAERAARRARLVRAAAFTPMISLALGLAYCAVSLAGLVATTSFTRGGYVYFTVQNLEAVEPNAVVCTWWAAAWGWWYAQFVDGHRPDVSLLPKGPDDCVRDVLPQEFGKHPVYVPAMTEKTRASDYAFFPSGDLWKAVAVRRPLAPGMLLKGPDERIFFFDGEQRHWIPSLEVFAARGFSWDAVRLTPDYVLKDVPEGLPLSPQAAP